MSKRLLTRYNGRLLNLLVQEGRIIECQAFPAGQDAPAVGGIYVARVSHVVGRLRSAFLSVGAYNLFMSLQDFPKPLFCSPENRTIMKEGDEILVQVNREAIGSKDACADCHLSLNGRYLVVLREERGEGEITFSRKITDTGWKRQMKEVLVPLCGQIWEGEHVSLLVRTNAYTVSESEIQKEAEELLAEYARILAESVFRPAGSCVYRPVPDYIRLIRDTPASELEEVVSDDKELLEEAKRVLASDPGMKDVPFRLYDDSLLSLSACYGITSALEKALSRQVWLPCGGYITIEQTEALTAVDVNSAKAVSGFKGNTEESFLAINLEAARELMAQLRLRNISGMILADFINLSRKENEERLMRELSALAAADPVKTVIVDMTKLGLVEITRKKVRDTLDKQLHS